MSDYKFTASEFAKMLGITTSAVRKQRLKGKLEGQYIKKGSEYFYASPPKSRPNKVEVTPYSNPKFHGSVYRPKKHPSYYFRKRNRDIPYDETKYHNAPNGSALQLTNDLRQMARIQDKLKASDSTEITDDVVLEVKKRIAKRKADKIKAMQDAQRSMLPVYNKGMQMSLKQIKLYDPPMTGRWFNHQTKKYEDYTPKKKEYKYYG